MTSPASLLSAEDWIAQCSRNSSGADGCACIIAHASASSGRRVLIESSGSKDYYICMRTAIVFAFAVLLAAALAPAQTAPVQTSWKLVWSDEFNGPRVRSPTQLIGTTI